MDPSVAIPLGSLILGSAMVVFAALTFKSQRDDIREKAEINYVQSLEARLKASEDREKIVQEQLGKCRENEVKLREEMNVLRAELIAALYDSGQAPSQLRRPLRRPPNKSEEETS